VADYADRIMANPIIAVGIVLLIAYSVYYTLIKLKIFRAPLAKNGNRILEAILRHGFQLALATIILGFLLQAVIVVVPRLAEAKRVAGLLEGTKKEYFTSFDLYGQQNQDGGSALFLPTDSKFASEVPISPEFRAPALANEGHSGGKSINFIPGGNPVTGMTDSAIGSGPTPAISSAIVNSNFNVSDADNLTISFFGKSTSNPSPVSVHGCDSTLMIYVQRDLAPWEVLTAQCGQHKSESQGWGRYRYQAKAGKALTMKVAFSYLLQQNEVADPFAVFLIDDLDIRVDAKANHCPETTAGRVAMQVKGLFSNKNQEDCPMQFEQVAPYLSNPLVLIGFVLSLMFSVHRALIKSGIIKPPSPATGGRIVFTILKYGLWISVLIIVLGFATVFFGRSS